MAKNPLQKESGAQETIQGKGVGNLRKVKQVQRVMPDGTVVMEPTGFRESSLDPDGKYTETEVRAVVYDQFGNPIPTDNPEQVILSYSGLLIPSPTQRAVCTCIFHRQINRNIYIGQDGRALENGAGICRHCQTTRTTLQIVCVILGLGVLYGIHKGLSVF